LKFAFRVRGAARCREILISLDFVGTLNGVIGGIIAVSKLSGFVRRLLTNMTMELEYMLSRGVSCIDI